MEAWQVLMARRVGMVAVFGAIWAWGPACMQSTCADGETRVDGRCARTCNATGDCDRTSSCVDGVCQPGRNDGADAGTASGGASSSSASASSNGSQSSSTTSASSSSSSSSGTSSSALQSSASSGGVTSGIAASSSTGGSGTASASSSTSSSSSTGGQVVQLGWSGPAQVDAGACTAFQVVRDSAPGQTLDIALAGSATVRFASDPNCLVTIAQLQMPGGDANASVFVVATLAGPAQLNAAAGAAMAAHALDVVASAAATLQWLSPPQSLRVSQCSKPAVVGTVDAYGNPALHPGGVVPVLVSAFSSLRLFSDTACATPTLLLQWPQMQSSLTFHFRADDAGSGSLTANTAGLSAMQTLDVVPAVRSGSCSFSTFLPQQDCAIPGPPVADLNRTWLVFQATSEDDSPSNSMISCMLGTATTIVCARQGSGSAATVTWSVVEFSPPTLVQHLQTSCMGPTTILPLPVPVDPAHTFVTISAQANNGTLRGGNMVTAELLDTNNVALRSSNTGCDWTQAYVQVVEHPGANVTQGELSVGGNAASQFMGPQDPSRMFVLYSWQMNQTGVDGCEAMIKGSLSGDNLMFERGLNRSSCGSTPIERLVYQRVEMVDGTQVFPAQVMISGGDLSGSTAIGPTEVALTTVFTGGMFNGLAAGQGRRLGTGDQQEVLVNLTQTGPGNVDAVRATDRETADFALFAVEWAFPSP